MSQSLNFWTLHGEKGAMFKEIIIDGGWLDKRIGFPVRQILNQDLLEEYKTLVSLRRTMKEGYIPKEVHERYKKLLDEYNAKLKMYHNEK